MTCTGHTHTVLSLVENRSTTIVFTVLECHVSAQCSNIYISSICTEVLTLSISALLHYSKKRF